MLIAPVQEPGTGFNRSEIMTHTAGAASPSRILILLARAGYAARGIVFIIVGALAFLAALGPRGEAPGTRGALQELLAQPFGDALLAVVAVGLLAFALWRFVQGGADVDRHGSDAIALIIRAALIVSGIVYLALLTFAVSLLLGNGGGAGEDAAARDWTARLMAMPFGRWLVAAVGLGVVVTGFATAFKGWKGKFERRLDLPAHARSWAVPVSRFGLVARGFVFALVGGFVIVAAWSFNADEARGLAGALAMLQRQPHGWLLLGVTAAGLAAFGVYGLIEAFWRRIDPPPLQAISKGARVAVG